MSKKVTTEEFIKKAKEIHGDKYDYSKVEYIGNKTKVCIICPEHGEFWQTPDNHLHKHGCPKCYGNAKLTTEEFIQKAREIHGDKYDYSKAKLVNSSTKICIICPEHGEFKQVYGSHLNGCGCPKCANKQNSNSKRSTNQNFIEKAVKVHGDKYIYSKVNYVDSKTKVCIICPKHGEFWQTPSNHLSGFGCKKCGDVAGTKKRRTSEDAFIKKAIEVHGDKYDYSKVIYGKSNSEKVIITCPTHGDFEQTPNKHLMGQGCPKCTNKIKSDTVSFIKKARKVHGNKYDYSKVEYVNARTKVCVICPRHGEWWQTPGNHLSGFGCKGCANDILTEKLSNSLEDFIQKAKNIHSDKYDYSKSIYKGFHSKLCIICPEHGEFWQTPASHISNRKSGCPCCVGKKKEYAYNNRKRLTTESFIEKARNVHGNKYDYSKVVYGNNNRHKVTIICPTHGEFTIAPDKHLCGDGCRKCGIERAAQAKLLNTKIFIDRSIQIHGNKYDYSKVEYINNLTKVCIICPEHGEFWQSPAVHWRQNTVGCPECAKPKTGLEDKIKHFLIENKYEFNIQQKFDWLKNKKKLSLDFYLPEHKIAIECQGRQHFEPIPFYGGIKGFNVRVKRDNIKRQLCEAHGIKIFYYSNLGIEYPYKVYEDLDELLNEIKNFNNL